VKKAATPVAKTAVMAVQTKRHRRKAAVKAPAKARPGRTGRAPPKPDRRIAGIRAAVGELSRALDPVEKARATLEESFARAAAGNIARAQGALETLRRLSDSAPLLDVRNLERTLGRLAEGVDDLKDIEGKARKRYLLAVDRFLDYAAARLELAVTPAAGAPIKLLSERLATMEALRARHQSAVQDRFRARLDNSRRVLAAVAESSDHLDRKALGDVARELESALCLSKAFAVGKLQGKPRDLYSIDGFVKRLDRRMARVQALMARKKEPSDG
jgi:hypothetical protein